tara:strand:+ start:7195 stop:7827 length:633 start_codon:yes stop_codon:yes gene_type:complete
MKKIFTLVALMLVQHSYALELKGIDGVEILAINGKKIDSSMFSDDTKPNLEPGKNQIVVRYAKEFYVGQELRSRPSIFTIDIQQDTQISVDNFRTENKAQRAVNNGLDWHITSKDNKYTVTDSHVLIDNGFFPYNDIEEVVWRYNQKNNISTEAIASTEKAEISNTATNKNSINSRNSGSDQYTIQEFYKKLSNEDKKAFRMWLIEQEMK